MNEYGLSWRRRFLFLSKNVIFNNQQRENLMKRRKKNRNRKLAIKIYHDSIKKAGGEK